MVAQIFNLSTWEAEVGRLEFEANLFYISNSRPAIVVLDPVFQKLDILIMFQNNSKGDEGGSGMKSGERRQSRGHTGSPGDSFCFCMFLSCFTLLLK